MFRTGKAKIRFLGDMNCFDTTFKITICVSSIYLMHCCHLHTFLDSSGTEPLSDFIAFKQFSSSAPQPHNRRYGIACYSLIIVLVGVRRREGCRVCHYLLLTSLSQIESAFIELLMLYFQRISFQIIFQR